MVGYALASLYPARITCFVVMDDLFAGSSLEGGGIGMRGSRLRLEARVWMLRRHTDVQSRLATVSRDSPAGVSRPSRSRYSAARASTIRVMGVVRTVKTAISISCSTKRVCSTRRRASTPAIGFRCPALGHGRARRSFQGAAARESAALRGRQTSNVFTEVRLVNQLRFSTSL